MADPTIQEQLTGAVQSLDDTAVAYHALSQEVSDAVNGGAGINITIRDSAIPGAGKVWFGSSPPDGWLECDGAAVSRTDYADLFAAIGTLWGVGDGSTTFNIPDLRGVVARGWDNGRGLDPGRLLASYQADVLGAHNHSQGSRALLNTYGGGSLVGNRALVGTGTGLHPTYDNALTSSTGGDETRGKNTSVMYCIKY